jgi:ankyrin repeat protein
MLKILIDNGADAGYKNTIHKQNVMHIAAKFDNAFALTYFHLKQNMDLTSTDSDGNKPLHIACSNGSNKAIYYLLGLTEHKQLSSYINLVNNHGQSAIHLAVINAVKFKSFDRIRELFFKGGNIELRD